MNLSQLLDKCNGTPLKFLIREEHYQLSEEAPEKGDTVLDARDCSHGIHDGLFKNMIAVKDGWVTEGVPKEHVRKLELVK